MARSIICEMTQGNRSNQEGLICILVTLFLFLSNTSFSQTAAPPDLGSVEGVVLDQQNKPVPNANVWALPEQDGATTTFASYPRVTATTSDAAGRFVLTHVPIGRIYVYGFKESEGYPYGFNSFYSPKYGQSWVVVEAKPASVISGVILHLGPKSAYLKVNATDEDGVAVPIGYQLDRDDIPGPFYTSVPTDHRLVGVGFFNGVMLVPPLPFRLTVQADGYEPWHYGGKHWAGKDGLITLKSGQTLSLNVRLRKK
jgi:hypothetical protein